MKITKKLRREYIRTKLATDRTWAKKALLKIYSYQTASEKRAEHTMEDNGVGFTGFDGEILTSFSRQLIKGRTLTDKQWKILHKKVVKYWGQILEVCDPVKLNTLIWAEVESVQGKLILKYTCPDCKMELPSYGSAHICIDNINEEVVNA